MNKRKVTLHYSIQVNDKLNKNYITQSYISSLSEILCGVSGIHKTSYFNEVLSIRFNFNSITAIISSLTI